VLVAVTGFAGAGKTTAIDYLESQLSGTKIYVGGYVCAEMERRNLAPTAENESLVRQAMREEEGADALAKRALPEISQILGSGAALIDAIYLRDEWALYRRSFQDRATLIHIDTCFNTRAVRLSAREARPLTAKELAKRDALERKRFALEAVFDLANFRLPNEDDIPALYRRLDDLVSRLRPA
jgi:dephospho-CoA kinase